MTVNKYLISFIILVYNAGNKLRSLLKIIASLPSDYSIEIIMIDSGSTDETAGIIEECKKTNKQCKIIEIRKRDFNYGLTRNLGVAIAKGKYVCFISADARPVALSKMIEYIMQDFKINGKVTAVYAKQIPHSYTDSLYNLEVSSIFSKLDEYRDKSGLVIQNQSRKQKDAFLLYFLSNVFAFYKRSYLKVNPFRKVERGEDLIIGKRIIQDGLTKIYDSRCIVVHSHDYTLLEYLKNQKEEFKVRLLDLNLPLKSKFTYKIESILNSKKSYVRALHMLKLVSLYLIKSGAYIWAQTEIFFDRLKWRKLISV